MSKFGQFEALNIALANREFTKRLGTNGNKGADQYNCIGATYTTHISNNYETAPRRPKGHNELTSLRAAKEYENRAQKNDSRSRVVALPPA